MCQAVGEKLRVPSARGSSRRSWIRCLCVLMMVGGLYGCPDEPESETPPEFPYNAEAIRNQALRPNGSLAELRPEEIETAVRSAENGLALPFAFVSAVESLILSLETDFTMKDRGDPASAEASDDNIRTSHAQILAGNVNGWVELEILCGDQPANHQATDGHIDLVVFATGDADGGTFEPVGVAWGTARNCKLWGQDNPVQYDGDFALLLPEGDETLTVYEMRGTQTTDVESAVEYAGYLSDDEVAWNTTVGMVDLVVGTAPNVYFVHDCSGRWLCDLAARSCTFDGDAGEKVRRSCQNPIETVVSW